MIERFTLAAHVGGIGANRAHPAEFFYDNLMMGGPLLHGAWRRAGVAKFIAIPHRCPAGRLCTRHRGSPSRARVPGRSLPRRWPVAGRKSPFEDLDVWRTWCMI